MVYIPLPKGFKPKLHLIHSHDDGKSWHSDGFTQPMYVTDQQLQDLSDGEYPRNIEEEYLVDNGFLYRVVSKQQALWIWDNYKQAGEPELVLLDYNGLNWDDSDYVETRVENKAMIEKVPEDSYQPILAIAVGYVHELEEVE